MADDKPKQDQTKPTAEAAEPSKSKPAAKGKAKDTDAKPTDKTDQAAKPADGKDGDAKPKAGAAKATEGKPAGKKRKIKAPSEIGRVYVQATFNNTVLSFTDHEGHVLTWGSPGAAGFKGTRKSTPYAATIATQQAAERAKQTGLKTVDVFVRGVGSGRDAAVRALQNSGLSISSLQDLTPTPHNGVRAKKPRRV